MTPSSVTVCSVIISFLALMPTITLGGASQHNSGKGIRLKLTLYPLDNPTVPRRKNARHTQINAITQVHKDYGLREFIIKCLDTVERCDLLDFSSIYRYPDGCKGNLKMADSAGLAEGESKDNE